MILPPLRSTLFPYTTLFRSRRADAGHPAGHLSTGRLRGGSRTTEGTFRFGPSADGGPANTAAQLSPGESAGDRKSTRLNSSHTVISYAVFCLKKKNHLNTAT